MLSGSASGGYMFFDDGLGRIDKPVHILMRRETKRGIFQLAVINPWRNPELRVQDKEMDDVDKRDR